MYISQIPGVQTNKFFSGHREKSSSSQREKQLISFHIKLTHKCLFTGTYVLEFFHSGANPIKTPNMSSTYFQIQALQHYNLMGTPCLVNS